MRYVAVCFRRYDFKDGHGIGGCNIRHRLRRRAVAIVAKRIAEAVGAVFTIFVPYYLTVRHMKQRSLSGLFCFLFGLTVVICEIVYEWK